MKNLQKLIAKNVIDRMKSAKPPISLNKLAVEADIDKSSLSKTLHGQRRMNIEQLERIAKFLEVDPSALLRK